MYKKKENVILINRGLLMLTQLDLHLNCHQESIYSQKQFKMKL